MVGAGGAGHLDACVVGGVCTELLVVQLMEGMAECGGGISPPLVVNSSSERQTRQESTPLTRVRVRIARVTRVRAGVGETPRNP